MGRMRCSVFVLVWLLTCSFSVLAQQPSLDELQEKLNEAKRKAQKKALPNMEQEDKRVSDELRSKAEKNLEEEKALRLKKSLQDQAEQINKIEQTIKELENLKRVRDEQEKMQEKALKVERFSFVGDYGGGVQDSRTGLLWAQSDNGTGITWRDALRYCLGKGGGWRLPTVSELEALEIADGSSSNTCGDQEFEFVCNLPPIFRVTTGFFWSSEQDGSSRAWIYDFYSGREFRNNIHEFSDQRALCVRSR